MTQRPPLSPLFPYTTLFRSGYAAGLYAGSQTISASMGLATDAINRLGLPPEQAKGLLDAIPVAYAVRDRKSTRLNSSHTVSSYAVFCLKKKNGSRVDHRRQH